MDILRYSFELAYTTIMPYMGTDHASSTFYYDYVILEFGRVYFLLFQYPTQMKVKLIWQFISITSSSVIRGS